MVTKQVVEVSANPIRLILENHMVTKHTFRNSILSIGLILAKNHMVTKLI